MAQCRFRWATATSTRISGANEISRFFARTATSPNLKSACAWSFGIKFTHPSVRTTRQHHRLRPIDRPYTSSRVYHQTPGRAMSKSSGDKFYNYDDKIFRSISNSATGEVSSATTFHYHQDPTNPGIVWAEYSGGTIVRGFLIATVQNEQGSLLNARYQHVNQNGELMTGQCTSRAEMSDDGRIRLLESWEWTCGGEEGGESVVEEVKN